MKNKKGYTLMEILVVVGLVAILFSAFLGILINSETYWNKGQNKITEQQEARLAMDAIAKDLRESNTYWNITISSNEIIFYKPDFNASGYYTGIHWVGYRLNPSNAHQLVKKEDGDADYTPVANHIQSVSFAGSTDNCATFTSTSVLNSCPRVRVTITTMKDKNFTLTSDVTLRNEYVASEGAPPEQGEF